MHSHEPTEEELNVLEQMGYEPSDIAADKAAKYIGFTAGFAVLTFAASWGIIWLVQSMTGSRAVDLSGAPRAFRRMPEAPYPLLQSNRTAQQDTKDLLQKEKQKVNTFGASLEPGMARVPITDAMTKTADEGLPTRPNAGEVEPK